MPLSADDRFILLRIKVERAKEHFRDLERETLACRGKTKRVPLNEDDPQTKQIISQHWEELQVYPFAILAIAGDVIHALRSALDHLAYQLAVVGGEGKTPSRRIAFPIAKDRDTYEAEKAGKVEGIGPEAVKAIDALKPYKGGNDTLWRIHELDNTDKHRFVFVIAQDALFVAPWFNNQMPFLIRPRTLNTDAPLFSGVFDSEAEDDVNFEIEEVVCQSQVSKGNALLPTLLKYIDVVEKLIESFRVFLNSSVGMPAFPSHDTQRLEL
jgi:hypothetical protein